MTWYLFSDLSSTYTCELDSQSGNIWTATIFKQGTTNERRCIQVIPMTQQLPGGAEGEMFLLFRALDQSTTLLVTSNKKKQKKST